MYTEKRIFNNESVRPDIPLSPNIFRRVEAGTAAVFREKIFPICLGSQSGAPSLKPEKREREGDSENLREREKGREIERVEEGKTNVVWRRRGERNTGNGGKSVV